MLNMKWTMTAVMLAAAFAGTARQASAQTSQNYRGKFELPFEARFGNVVLPPGSYTVTTLEGAKGIRIYGDRAHVAILAAGYDIEPETKNAKLILVDTQGMYTLQSFESGVMGKALHFVVTKNPRGTVERAAAVKPTVELGLQ
jgi:hypothetical protein